MVPTRGQTHLVHVGFPSALRVFVLVVVVVVVRPTPVTVAPAAGDVAHGPGSLGLGVRPGAGLGPVGSCNTEEGGVINNNNNNNMENSGCALVDTNEYHRLVRPRCSLSLSPSLPNSSSISAISSNCEKTRHLPEVERPITHFVSEVKHRCNSPF